MLKGKDIVVIGLQPWYYPIGSNCKNIAATLARENRVVYVNCPINRKTFYSKDPHQGVNDHISIIRTKGEQLHRIGEHFWEYYPVNVVESINWLPSTGAFKAINAVNNRRFAKDIREAVRRLGFRDYILFNDNDFFNGHALKKYLHPRLYVYYCRDYLRGNSYWAKHGDVLEPELIRSADLVTANSGFLADYCREHNPESYYIGQGCNLDLFDARANYPVPEEMKHIQGPVIGYVGAIIETRLDQEIIRTIARAHPEWNVVLVGPEDEAFAASDLHALPNVHFLGRKPIEQLSSFVQQFDVCINPQLVNMLTIGNYPLKVDEYLAMGKPVVATRTKTMALFEDYTYLAETPADYPALIEKALRENNVETQEARIAFAHTHTWEASVGELSKQIERKLNHTDNGSSGRQATKMGSGHRKPKRTL
jgi:teichuronic acid biosynthesis glycosyltransferase TuaH